MVLVLKILNTFPYVILNVLHQEYDWDWMCSDKHVFANYVKQKYDDTLRFRPYLYRLIEILVVILLSKPTDYYTHLSIIQEAIQDTNGIEFEWFQP